ncbi:right-handed parallel beta-helix repeat-containing protein [Streptosporangium sp. NPDC006007]|uniref:right-handed parallel beta-helix repeat-containing protein n=1 Tax=Streptosporangium sp. NPDC006007 TaxID=3154575 RepID=UPI0033A07FC6
MLMAVLIPSVPAGASMSAVGCGDTLTSSVALTVDLTCAPGNGLTVDADNITIDLAGHTVSGDMVVDTHSRVTVKNGRLSGLSALRSAAVTLSKVAGVSLTVERLSTVIAEGTPSTCVINSIRVYLAYLTIDHCTVHGSGSFNQARQPAVRSSILSNGRLTFNESFGGVFTENVFDKFPVEMKWDSRNFTFRGNAFKNADTALSTDGILGGTWDTTVEHNVFSDNAIGMRASPNFDRVIVRDNVFSHNGTVGLFINNTVLPRQLYPVSGNVFSHNGHTPSGITDLWHQSIQGGLHVFNSSNTDGPDYPPITLTRNIGSGNAGHLIWGMGPQVADGGGNQGPCGPQPHTSLTCF